MTPLDHQARRAATDGGADQTESYATFWLGTDLFGTVTGAVKEVTGLPPLTPIPHAPAAVRGYANLRGHIVLVLDLNCLVRGEPAVPRPESRLVVFQPELGETLSVLVDRVGDIVPLSPGQLETHRDRVAAAGRETEPPPELKLIRGVGKLDGQLLMILAVPALRPILERAVASRGLATGGGRWVAGGGPSQACAERPRV